MNLKGLKSRKGLNTALVAAVTGGLLLTYSMTSLAATGSAYESYKNAIKMTASVKNVTVNADFEIIDNGVNVVSGNSMMKKDDQNRSSKRTISVDGVTREHEISMNNGKMIAVTDGQFYTLNMEDDKLNFVHNRDLSVSSSAVKLAEMVTDTLIGDVKNLFVKDANTIRVELEGAQIPELARLALSAAAENRSQKSPYMNKNRQPNGDHLAIMDKLPKLSQIDVKSVAMNANLDGDFIKDQTLTVHLTGQGEDGLSHEVILKMKADITDVGSTQPDSIDTTGKAVQTIEWKDLRHGK